MNNVNTTETSSTILVIRLLTVGL